MFRDFTVIAHVTKEDFLISPTPFHPFSPQPTQSLILEGKKMCGFSYPGAGLCPAALRECLGFRARELSARSAAVGPVAMGSMGIVQCGGQERKVTRQRYGPLSKELVSHAEEPLLQAPAPL